jgi:tRNA-dihydrouridine synthase
MCDVCLVGQKAVDQSSTHILLLLPALIHLYLLVMLLQLAQPTGLQLIGNGDVFSYTDWNAHVGVNGNGPLTTCMIGRGALIKPWVGKGLRDTAVPQPCASPFTFI